MISRAPHTEQNRPVYRLRIEGRSGPAGIHALRALLKTLLRRHGFRCLDARQERLPKRERP
jgi:hypothetical protein